MKETDTCFFYMELGLFLTKVPYNPLILYGQISINGKIIILNFI